MLKSTAKLAATRRSAQFLRGRLLLVAALLLLLAGLIGDLGREWMSSTECHAHLRRIYRAIELYESTRGVMPRLSFYPDNPFDGETSMRAVLANYGAEPDQFICPGCRDRLRRQGLTYIWNMELNARRRQDLTEPVWMVTEINALSPQVDRPHPFHYNVLYSDGSIRRQRHPPGDLLATGPQ